MLKKQNLHEPEGGYVDDPRQATRDAARAAEAAGARFVMGTRVVEVLTAWSGGGQVVRGVRLESGDRIESPVVLNCAGPHSGWLNLIARTPLALNTAPLRQVVVDARAPSLEKLSEPLPVIADLLRGFYLRPDPECCRIGAVWPQDETEFLADPDDPGDKASPELIERRVSAARGRVPGLEVEGARGLIGVYDVTIQDWYPIVDRTDTRGYFVAIGTSGAWFKAGPVLGLLAAQVIRQNLDGVDNDLRPLEVTLPLTGYRFPMSLFSRRRRPIRLEYGGGVLG